LKNREKKNRTEVFMQRCLCPNASHSLAVHVLRYARNPRATTYHLGSRLALRTPALPAPQRNGMGRVISNLRLAESKADRRCTAGYKDEVILCESRSFYLASLARARVKETPFCARDKLWLETSFQKPYWGQFLQPDARLFYLSTKTRKLTKSE